MSRGYDVLSLVFLNPDWVEVVYVDEDLDSPDVKDAITRTIRREEFKDLIGSIQEDVEQLIDDSFKHRRNRRPSAEEA
jgi:hypothetical protein